jgi:hypothetical protein
MLKIMMNKLDSDDQMLEEDSERKWWEDEE